MAIYQEPEVPDFWQLAKRPGTGQYLDPWGPLGCTCHSMARAIMRYYEGKKPAGITGIWPPNGYAIRLYTGDTSGGTNLSQMRDVGIRRYGFSLGTLYRLPWPDFEDELAEGRGAILQLWYRRIRDSKFRGSEDFFSNHAVFVAGINRSKGLLTGVIDPLADGRRPGLFKGPADYPISLLRAAAGELNVASSGYRALGSGLVYAGLTRPTGAVSLPDTSTPPAPINYGVTTMNILDGPAAQALVFPETNPNIRHMALKKGQPIYRSPSLAGTNILDRLGSDVNAVMTGIPANGWRTVIVSTRNFPDGIRRDVEAYVPKTAGVIS